MSTEASWTPPATRELRTPDGRLLRYCLYGPEGGEPVFALNGTPDTRWVRPEGVAAYEDAGLRVLVYDRPGYGGSTRRPGRTVGDAAQDVGALARAMGWDRFAVTGFSGGGPHALACAALLPGRVTRCAAMMSPAPFDAPGLDFFAGMAADDVRCYRLAAAGDPALRPLLERGGAEAVARVERGEPMLAPDGGAPDSDLERLRARPAAADPGRVARNRAMWLDGVDGRLDDLAALSRPWGFDVREIGAPTSIWYGLADAFVPRQHGDWLRTQVPGAQSFTFPGGHVPDEDDECRMLGWLAPASA
ncbi:alpha/beta fold hydrolase [Streptomyces sp. CA-111067]|uniref:alpha/beta fold hydrolase n=1 Tax=Streptomyces sp. CA-111067 TaxID=3240046 RepID=UPI003D9847CC